MILPKLQRDHIPVKFWSRVGRSLYVSPEPREMRSVCPGCGIYLPDRIANGELSSEIIAIVGARSAGKSNYFGVMLNDLRRRLSGQVGFEVVDAETYSPSTGRIGSSTLYQERYGKQLYDEKSPRAVGQTPSVQTVLGTNLDPRIPLIYQLRFPKHSWQHVTHPLAHRVPVYLLIYDAAGEDFADGSITKEYFAPFLERATGILFLIDPFEFPGIRRQLPQPVRELLKPVEAEPGLIVDHVCDTIRGRLMSSARKLTIPAAFVLTKADLFDQIPGVVHANSPLRRESVHNGGFDKQGCDDLAATVRQHVSDWDSRELLVKAESNFTKYSFFAVSALGQQPERDLSLSKAPQSRRIGDPLLWLFWQRGYVPAISRV